MTRGKTEAEARFRINLRSKLDPWPTPVVFRRGTTDIGPRMAIVALSGLPAIPYRYEEQLANETGTGIGTGTGIDTKTGIEDPVLATVVDIRDELLQLFVVHTLISQAQFCRCSHLLE